ncbi:uncharacterized protein LY89DRAFT_779431 [Mollisia scopiformis]|uniref:Apple domain-containing protein n=1 Tax=Mollisia scopiformis TaxID=149040 RepID=A0A194XKT8_MOLSC|nr:uncharacterized protein LY89DRAFT_779431 [Mollisia scopiformis]KUJ20709.1 hypothetical protein LY89DRAFT_779431 [Mollisia scopiformis]
MAVTNAKNRYKDQYCVASTTSTTTTVTATSTTTTTTTTTTTSDSSASTSTSASTITVPTSGFISLDCPALDATTLGITLQSTSLFTVTCGQDFSGPNHDIDILALVVYSLEDCAMACASYNLNWKSTICKAVRFNADLGQVGINYGTCWLKNGTGTIESSNSDTSAGMILQT